MSTMRALKRQQNAAQRREVSQGIRNQIIKISTVMPMDDPKNAAAFRVEETRRSKAGEEAQVMDTPNKGKAAGSKGSKKPLRAVSREPTTSGTSAPVGQKCPSEGPIPQANKGKGKMDDDSDMAAEVARLASAPELERISELTAAH